MMTGAAFQLSPGSAFGLCRRPQIIRFYGGYARTMPSLIPWPDSASAYGLSARSAADRGRQILSAIGLRFSSLPRSSDLPKADGLRYFSENAAARREYRCVTRAPSLYYRRAASSRRLSLKVWLHFTTR